MANTSRKRPPPSSNGTTAAAARPPATAHATGAVNVPALAGIDVLLAKYARHLHPGASISVQLIKGPSTNSVDPIAARKAASKAARSAAGARASGGGISSGLSSGNDSDNNTSSNTVGRGLAAPISFPRLAKFPETVTTPDFRMRLRDGRMYEEEVPKAKDESDEEESTAYKPANINAEVGDPTIFEATKNKKKKRRWRRNDPRPRRWVLQEKAEFFDRIRKRKQRTSTGTGDDDDEQGISNQYHGVVESNASKYVLLSVAPTTTAASPALKGGASKMATEQISIQPIHGFHTFSQPYKFASLTMEEAEHAIERQRDTVTRYMMHGKLAAQNTSNEARAALATGVAAVGGGRTARTIGPAPKAMSRARLLGKLAGGGIDEDDDDVMADVRYSTSKGRGGTSRARRELLSSLGDEGMRADDDGVLGGANDSEFGGKRRFARVATNKDADDAPGGKKGEKGGGGKTSTGFEAGAMEEGFYQRDVAAEYEALDYDVNEQFDNDDVNVGEDEMQDDGGGYGGDFHDSGDDAMLDSEDEGGSDDDDAFKGMATASGMRAMLAKARGESPVTTSQPGSGMDALLKKDDGITDSLAAAAGDGKGINQMLDAAKKTAEVMEKKKGSPDEKKASASAAAAAAAAIEKDKDGKRLITLEAVRREIWLNNGAITSKRLTKKFDVTKKNPERQALFKTIVMELCTIKKDADGNKLVLKQHYAKI